MENISKIETWKLFLEGRIAQEEGKNDKALDLFEQALKDDPENVLFLNAKCIALNSINKSEEAFETFIKSEYSKMARTLVGKNDVPEQWIKGLKALHNKISSPGFELIKEVCW